MKIRKFNESIDWEYNTQLIKDIIIEIKDEYPGITGDINEIRSGILIKFNTELIKFKGKIHSVERFKDINRFESIVLECFDRINDALNTSVKISFSSNDGITVLIPN